MDDFAPIEQLAGNLLQSLSAQERRSLLRKMARTIRASQSQRIGRQQNPDGSAFAARRAQDGGGRLRRRGQIKRAAMFRKLRSTKFLKSGSTDTEAWIGFTGRAAAIARVHQEGLMDEVTKGGRKVRYARRELLGLTEPEREIALDMLLDHIAARALVE